VFGLYTGDPPRSDAGVAPEITKVSEESLSGKRRKFCGSVPMERVDC
jgi:hypothetical protein